MTKEELKAKLGAYPHVLEILGEEEMEPGKWAPYKKFNLRVLVKTGEDTKNVTTQTYLLSEKGEATIQTVDLLKPEMFEGQHKEMRGVVDDVLKNYYFGTIDELYADYAVVRAYETVPGGVRKIQILIKKDSTVKEII